MTTTTQSNEEKVLVVVGRSEDQSNFVGEVTEFLFDNFTIVIAQPLEENAGIDGKVRMIGFVVGPEVGVLTMESQAMRFRSTGGNFHAAVFDSMETAMAVAKEKYDFDSGVEAAKERAEKIREVVAEFKPFSADEVEFFSVFDSLMDTGKIRMIRGFFNDEPVCVLAIVTQSEDGSETSIKCLAILLTTASLVTGVETLYSRLGG